MEPILKIKRIKMMEEYGEAMNAAQRFENTLGIFVYFLNKSGIKGAKPDSDEYLDWLLSKPLQRILQRLDAFGINFFIGSKKLRQIFEKAKEYRDFLAHRIFAYSLNFNDENDIDNAIMDIIIIKDYFIKLLYLLYMAIMKNVHQNEKLSDKDFLIFNSAFSGDITSKFHIGEKVKLFNIKRAKRPQIEKFPFEWKELKRFLKSHLDT